MNRTRKKLVRKFKLPQWAVRSGAFLLIRWMVVWMGTLNYRFFRYDPSVDPGDNAFAGPAIYIFWHEYILLPVHVRPNCHLTMLISQHQDAQIVEYIAHSLGMDVIRGSTYRGGTTALLQLIWQGAGASLAIVPDGPRGPRRQLAQGCVYLSSRLQIPIVPVGVGYDRPWRIRRAWDKFAIPRPFSRARLVIGPRIQVPPELEREQLELHRQWFGQQLDELTGLAEDWAENRCTIAGSEKLYRHGPRHLKSAPQTIPALEGYRGQQP